MRDLLLAAESVGLTGLQSRYALRAAVGTTIEQIEADNHQLLLRSLPLDVAALALPDPSVHDGVLSTDLEDAATVSLYGGVGLVEAENLLPLVRRIIRAEIGAPRE